jgi:hypothetical protein
MHDGEWGYYGAPGADHLRVFVPNVRIRQMEPGFTVLPLRGYAGSMAVMQGTNCIGWISPSDLGYPDTKTWIEDTGYVAPTS